MEKYIYNVCFFVSVEGYQDIKTYQGSNIRGLTTLKTFIHVNDELSILSNSNLSSANILSLEESEYMYAVWERVKSIYR